MSDLIKFLKSILDIDISDETAELILEYEGEEKAILDNIPKKENIKLLTSHRPTTVRDGLAELGIIPASYGEFDMICGADIVNGVQVPTGSKKVPLTNHQIAKTVHGFARSQNVYALNTKYYSPPTKDQVGIYPHDWLIELLIKILSDISSNATHSSIDLQIVK